MSQHPDGRVFRAYNGGIIRPDKIRNVLIRDVLQPLAGRFNGNAAERSFVDGRLHSFRHYFCSKCARDGIPEQTVMLWLGHSDSRMVRIYFTLHDEDALRQMNKLKSVQDTGAA
jgi:integrase